MAALSAAAAAGRTRVFRRTHRVRHGPEIDILLSDDSVRLYTLGASDHHAPPAAVAGARASPLAHGQDAGK